MEGRKQRNVGSMANLPKEQAKYDLGSREQRGHITTGDGSMGPPLQSLITFCQPLLKNIGSES